MNNERVAKELLRIAKVLVGDESSKMNSREAGVKTADMLAMVADQFARYCIGDRDNSIRQLMKLKDKNFEGDAAGFVDTGEWNDLFNNLSADLLKALRKNLPV